MRLEAIQSALRERGFDAWLFYDHHYRDPIAYRILGMPEGLHVTRRWYYLVPAQGTPQKLVHRIEGARLDKQPGEKHEYSSWQELQEGLKAMLAPHKTVAMQYSPNNQIPYISLVDAGTIELIRSFGKTVVSSGDLVSRFEAAWSEEQIASHFAARDSVDRIMSEAFREVGQRCSNGGTTEYEIQKWIMQAMERESLVSDSTPIVGVNSNSSNPHYSPSAEVHKDIRKGDFLLFDMWAKKTTPGAVFYDITWTGVIGRAPSEREREIFGIVRKARNAAFEKVKKAVESGTKIAGWEVDKAARDSIATAGYGKYFVHRTGHSIGTEVHANGANMDNLETKDEREIIANTCFSVEPGIYLPEFGVRSEFNVLVRKGKAEVTGRVQDELVAV